MDEVEINCPNCKASLPKELQRELYAGKSITCENCGILLVPRVQGQASTLVGEPRQVSKAENSPGVVEISGSDSSPARAATPPLSKRQEWLESREQRNQERRERFEARIQQRYESWEQRYQQRHETKDQRNQERNETKNQRNQERNAIKEQRNQERKEIKDQRKMERKASIQAPSRPSRSPPSITREDRSREHLDRLKGHIHAFNRASLDLLKLFLGLFYIISIAGMVYTLIFYQFNIVLLVTLLLKLLPQYVIGAFMYWYETRRLHPWLSRDQYEFYGIDIVIVGIVGLQVYGIGIFLLIKGLMVMDYMIRQDRLSPKLRRDVLIACINGLDEISWMIHVLGATFAFSSMAIAMVNSVVYYAPDPAFITFLVLGLFGIISANNDLQKVSPRIRAWKFNKLGGKTLVNAFLGCACFGSGIPLLVKAILLFSIDSFDRHAPAPATNIEQPENMQPPQQQEEPQPLPRPGLRGPVLKPQQPIQPVITASPAPPNKAPGTLHERAPAKATNPARVKAKPASPAPILSRKSPASIEAFLQRSFSVLTPRVRKRLIKLKKMGMSDAEIEDVAEELVFHPEFEQLDIIDDYMSLNKDDVDPMHFLAVRNMRYDENTKKWILDQLKIIPEKDIPAFLDQMKNSQPN